MSEAWLLVDSSIFSIVSMIATIEERRYEQTIQIHYL
jgi:hypothetical protein